MPKPAPGVRTDGDLVVIVMEPRDAIWLADFLPTHDGFTKELWEAIEEAQEEESFYA